MASSSLSSLGNEISASISAANHQPVATFTIGGDIPIYHPDRMDVDVGNEETQQQSSERITSSSPIVLRWDPPNHSVGSAPPRVTFPLMSDADIKSFRQLLEDTQPATFGRGGQDVLDETYRKAQKLPATAFSTDFCPYKLGIIDAVCQVLLPSIRTSKHERSIRAELYNINIYSGPSGKFKAHVDTPRSAYQIGSLVVCLPVKHAGGELAVRHAGQTHTYDWSARSEEHVIQWAAFYSDCEHEVFEVMSGHRVTIT